LLVVVVVVLKNEEGKSIIRLLLDAQLPRAFLLGLSRSRRRGALPPYVAVIEERPIKGDSVLQAIKTIIGY